MDLSSTQGALCTVSVFFILHFTYLGVAYCVVRTHPTQYPPPRLRAVTPQNELGTGDRCPERFFQRTGLRGVGGKHPRFCGDTVTTGRLHGGDEAGQAGRQSATSDDDDASPASSSANVICSCLIMPQAVDPERRGPRVSRRYLSECTCTKCSTKTSNKKILVPSH